MGALKLLHHDFASVVLHVADALKIDPESHLIGLLMIKADLISATELRHFSLITFGYAAVCLVEGTGLMLEKRWAEYFTVTLTSLALPWECFELYKQFTPLRIALATGEPSCARLPGVAASARARREVCAMTQCATFA